jgi:hypothetical protein
MIWTGRAMKLGHRQSICSCQPQQDDSATISDSHSLRNCESRDEDYGVPKQKDILAHRGDTFECRGDMACGQSSVVGRLVLQISLRCPSCALEDKIHPFNSREVCDPM